MSGEAPDAHAVAQAAERARTLPERLTLAANRPGTTTAQRLLMTEAALLICQMQQRSRGSPR